MVYGSCGYTTDIVGYTDSNYGGDLLRRRSLICYVFTLFGCAITWKATLQSIVALYTIEAEYMSLIKGVKEGIWLHCIVDSLGLDEQKPIIYRDSQSVLSLTKNPVYLKRSKHIDARLNFIKDIIKGNVFSIEKIATKDNPTDMLTKSLPIKKFKHSLDLVNVCIA